MIEQVGSKRVEHVAELLSAVAALKPNVPVEFKIKRKDQSLKITLTPAQRPKMKPQMSAEPPELQKRRGDRP